MTRAPTRQPVKRGSPWMREYAADQMFIDFLTARSFECSATYEVDGAPLVTLRRAQR